MARILVVDSDRHGRRSLCELLSGHEIVCAPGASRARNLARRRPPDMAIVECLLRDGTGVQLLQDLRRVLPSLPVVLISPVSSPWIRRTVEAAGADQYLVRPLDPIMLNELTRRLLGDRPSKWYAVSDQELIRTHAVEFLTERLSEPVTLALLSAYLGMSKVSVGRKFRNVHGRSFREFLLDLRLCAAREMLATRDRSITDIAQAVGFGDLQRFDKMFRRKIGVSPSIYRKRLACEQL